MSTLKEKLFNTDAYKGPKDIVEVEGLEVEIRVPKFELIDRKNNATKKGNLTATKQGVEILIECVFDPDSGEKVFTEHDVERLMGSAAHKDGLLMQLLNAMNKLTRTGSGDVKDATKNS